MALFRGLAVVTFIATINFVLMVTIVILSLMYPTSVGWFLKGLSLIGNWILDALDRGVDASNDNTFLLVMYNIFESHVHIEHLLLSLITLSLSVVIAIPLSRLLGVEFSIPQRLGIYILGTIIGVVLALLVFSLAYFAPGVYKSIFGWIRMLCRSGINALDYYFDDSLWMKRLINLSRTTGVISHMFVLGVSHPAGLVTANKLFSWKR
jgi:hypothetical protein